MAKKLTTRKEDYLSRENEYKKVLPLWWRYRN